MKDREDEKIDKDAQERYGHLNGLRSRDFPGNNSANKNRLKASEGSFDNQKSAELLREVGWWTG